MGGTLIMNIQEVLEKKLQGRHYPAAKTLAPDIEVALRAAWNRGLADQHRFPVNSNNGVTAGTTAMISNS